jgi:hypothetical protein
VAETLQSPQSPILAIAQVATAKATTMREDISRRHPPTPRQMDDLRVFPSVGSPSAPLQYSWFARATERRKQIERGARPKLGTDH